MNNKNTNQPTSAPSLMGSSAKNINTELAKSGMISRLEDPTGQKKAKKQKSSFAATSTKISKIALVVLITAILATIILYFILRTHSLEDETNSPLVTYSNESHRAIDVNKPVNQTMQTITANETIVSADTEVVTAPTATILTEPETSLTSKTAESDSIQNPHEQLTKVLMSDNMPVSSTSSNKSAEEADASRQLASKIAKLQTEPNNKISNNKNINNKKQTSSKLEEASPKAKTTVKVTKTSKQDTDIKVIDALVAQKSDNSNDRDIKVLAALVSANTLQTGTQQPVDSAKLISKTPASSHSHPAKSNATPANQAQPQAQPMTLGNAGETIADELAKCSALNFIEAPICRVKTCFGHVGSSPECTPEFKKPEINTDSTAVMSGH